MTAKVDLGGGSRIIVAADFPKLETALDLAQLIGKDVACFKIGNEMAENIGAPQTVGSIVKAGSNVFRDAKLCDIPNTVAGSAAGLVQQGVVMFNMMCMAGKEALEAGRNAAAKRATELGLPAPFALGVTILTSLNFDNLQEQGLLAGVPANADESSKDKMVKSQVVKLALLAKSAGLDGVIASAMEATVIRAAWPEALIVTPGIRLPGADKADQKRVVTPKDAILAGADFLVVGRDITKAEDPVAAVKAYNDAIAEALAEMKTGCCCSKA